MENFIMVLLFYLLISTTINFGFEIKENMTVFTDFTNESNLINDSFDLSFEESLNNSNQNLSLSNNIQIDFNQTELNLNQTFESILDGTTKELPIQDNYLTNLTNVQIVESLNQIYIDSALNETGIINSTVLNNFNLSNKNVSFNLNLENSLNKTEYEQFNETNQLEESFEDDIYVMNQIKTTLAENQTETASKSSFLLSTLTSSTTIETELNSTIPKFEIFSSTTSSFSDNFTTLGITKENVTNEEKLIIKEKHEAKNFSIRIHLKGYKWKKEFSDSNSNESQEFLRNILIPLLIKQWNINDTDNLEFKLLKLFQEKKLAKQNLMRSLVKREITLDNQNYDLGFLIELSFRDKRNGKPCLITNLIITSFCFLIILFIVRRFKIYKRIIDKRFVFKSVLVLKKI